MGMLTLPVGGYLRRCCLCIILTLAGIGADLSVLERDGWTMLRLFTFAQLSEAVTIMVLSHLLFG